MPLHRLNLVLMMGQGGNASALIEVPESHSGVGRSRRERRGILGTQMERNNGIGVTLLLAQLDDRLNGVLNGQFPNINLWVKRSDRQQTVGRTHRGDVLERERIARNHEVVVHVHTTIEGVVEIHLDGAGVLLDVGGNEQNIVVLDLVILAIFGIRHFVVHIRILLLGQF